MSSASQSNGASRYSLESGTLAALEALLERSRNEIPEAFREHVGQVTFHSAERESRISLPCPFKETEAVSALKAVEAGAVAALTDLRHGKQSRKISIDFERAACFLFAAYISTIDGMGKGNPNVKSKLIGSFLFWT